MVVLYMNYFDESALMHMNQGSIYLNGCQISGYFDTKYTAVGPVELIF